MIDAEAEAEGEAEAEIESEAEAEIESEAEAEIESEAAKIGQAPDLSSAEANRRSTWPE